MNTAPWYTHENTGWLYESEHARNPLAIFANPEHAKRIVACVNACAGISTEQLERMNDIDVGLLARAYDVCSSLVEDWGENLVNDEHMPGSEAVESLIRVGGDALAVCAWTPTEPSKTD